MTGNENVSGLILEGVCGAGKTTLLRSLAQSPGFTQRPGLSSVVLSEHQTQRVLERKEREAGLTTEDNIALLNQHVGHLEALCDRLDPMPWREDNRSNHRVAYVLELFHVTHVAHYEHVQWEDVQGIDIRLAALSGKLCLLTVDDSLLEQRIVTRRDSTWRGYLERSGNTIEEAVEYHVRQQGLLRRWCAKSKLETCVIDTTDSIVQSTLNQVLDFWGAV